MTESVRLPEVDGTKFTPNGKKCEANAFAEVKYTQPEGLRACIRSTCMRGDPGYHRSMPDRAGQEQARKPAGLVRIRHARHKTRL